MTLPIRIAPFLFALLCFALPFVKVSCKGGNGAWDKTIEETTLTGWQVMTDSVRLDGNTQKNATPNYFLVGSLAALILGLLAALSERSRWLGMVCGLVAAGLLVSFVVRGKNAYRPDFMSDPTISGPTDSKPADEAKFEAAMIKMSLDAFDRLKVSMQPAAHVAIGCAVLGGGLCALGGKRRKKWPLPRV